MSPMTTHVELQIPPWGTPALWRAANDAVAAAVGRHGRRLKAAVRLAMGIEQGIAGLDGIMDALCAASCPACKDACCRRATIWYDFKDLICLQLMGARAPAAQIVKARGQPCPFHTMAGCALPRTARPFICTWYLCPVQRADFHHFSSAGAGDLMGTLSRLKRDRNDMENLFIQGIMA